MKKKIVQGELRLHRDGYGFVITGKKDEEDVFVPARYIGDALHTDVVQVQVVPSKKNKGTGKSLEGRIKKVVQRNVKKLLGRLERTGKYFRVIADDLRIRRMIVVPDKNLGGAKHGQNVIVKITKYPSDSDPMQGQVITVLGERGDLKTEKQAVIVHHHLQQDFNKHVLEQAQKATDLMNKTEIKSRKDLRDLPFITIDGESAMDFDDAVAVQKLDNGMLRLWVAIADVAHFVRQNTALDKAALERGTSVYFPGDCLPMLPQVLSNDLCSLKPNVDRLAMTVLMDIDSQGEIQNKQFFSSVIQSKSRMTYTEIKNILVDKKPKVRKTYKDLLPQFELMKKCYECLRKKRIARGSIDFDLPEPEIELSLTGNIEDIARADRHLGHMMIEEFMISANETVAEFLTQKKMGCIYRVHEPPLPEKIHNFAILMHNLGYKAKLRGNVTTKQLAEVVHQVRGKSEERLLNTSLLRSLSQAIYSPENLGHYGLGSECYCHFTSPIRRYPDLEVHRLLKKTLKSRSQKSGVRRSQSARSLVEIAEHCSRKERIAMEAEREIIKVYIAFFMQEKIGEIFEGVISHVTKFGFFVELKDFLVEGLVHKDSLPPGKYVFEEHGYCLTSRKKGLKFTIGDEVKIKVEEVNIPLRDIYFSLA